MADETIDTAEGEVPETVEKPQDKKVTKVTFTSEQQEHVNAMLAAERKSAEKKYKGQLDGSVSALDAVKGDVAFYEERMKFIIEVQIADFEPVAKELFSALPIREQLEKLADEGFMAKVRSKSKIPATPKSGGNENKPMFKRRISV